MNLKWKITLSFLASCAFAINFWVRTIPRISAYNEPPHNLDDSIEQVLTADSLSSQSTFITLPDQKNMKFAIGYGKCMDSVIIPSPRHKKKLNHPKYRLANFNFQGFGGIGDSLQDSHIHFFSGGDIPYAIIEQREYIIVQSYGEKCECPDTPWYIQATGKDTVRIGFDRGSPILPNRGDTITIFISADTTIVWKKRTAMVRSIYKLNQLFKGRDSL